MADTLISTLPLRAWLSSSHAKGRYFRFSRSSFLRDIKMGSIRCQMKTYSAVNPFNHDQEKIVWIWTENKHVMTTAVERGWNTFIFSSDSEQLASEWASIAKINRLFISDGYIYDSERKQIGAFAEVSSPSQLQELNFMVGQAEHIVLNCLDWQGGQEVVGFMIAVDKLMCWNFLIIPAENMVAAFQGSGTSIFTVAKTFQDAQVFLEALEKGMDGVVLHTDDINDILKLKGYLDRKVDSKNVTKLSTATVTRLEMMGMGDRVCVDLCSLLRPGEGVLVGSFARGLFLVHSECLESSYISSRPFRVNAGPVHAYIAVPGGKTSYLSELESGKEVIVMDMHGRQRTAIVGRVKIESRPLILVEAKIESAEVPRCSILLQNAETVNLVRPPSPDGEVQQLTIPVSALKVGDQVLLSIQASARHTDGLKSVPTLRM
ncbi:uncharacterized protein LOC131044943 isoform X2 [Cryptomeria japonica]|uniref:uncharacterized protein LOC131044943 isoform X2 n=1 Tax=Cryptomeria japonica TaxID=3369 RepID=UPI0025ACA338|nr:uncharacterized protein LOC131044943 isoform X2 [Cryptomeria japonica]